MKQLVLRSLDQEAPGWNPTGDVSQLMTIWHIVVQSFIITFGGGRVVRRCRVS